MKNKVKKIHWDQECPQCHKESLMITVNGDKEDLIIEQCLLCGYKNDNSPSPNQEVE